jgi:hypothetical protein
MRRLDDWTARPTVPAWFARIQLYPETMGGFVRMTPTISDIALTVIAIFVAIALFHGWG